MKEFFKDWDPRLRKLLSKVDQAVKWKIWKMEELDRWTRVS
jgi:salicylate hydroxylase